jgi:hypothetical protein
MEVEKAPEEVRLKPIAVACDPEALAPHPMAVE